MGKKSRMKAENRAARAKALENPQPSTDDKLLPCKSETYKSTVINDLFDNPMIKAAQAALSEEDKEKFRRLGESMFGGINFENGQSLNNMPPPMAEAVAYIESQLQAGMHPSVLDDNEKAILRDAYGDEWYLKWNYIKEDLDDIVTLTPTLKIKNVES